VRDPKGGVQKAQKSRKNSAIKDWGGGGGGFMGKDTGLELWGGRKGDPFDTRTSKIGGGANSFLLHSGTAIKKEKNLKSLEKKS